MPHPHVVAALLGLLGLIIGSFLAAISVRLPREEDIVATRSHCMSCGQTLKPWHLVPVFSWLALRGRCGLCKAAISPRYLLIELAAGGIGVWAALASPSLLFAGATAVLGWQLVLIAIIDAENFWLPDILTFPMAATGLLATGLIAHGFPWEQIIGLFAGFALLWGLAWLYKLIRRREGLGGGDPFLFAAAGAWVGWMGLPSVLLWACAVGFCIVLTLLVTRGKVSGTERLPFGTFLAVGVWLTWLYGPLGLV